MILLACLTQSIRLYIKTLRTVATAHAVRAALCVGHAAHLAAIVQGDDIGEIAQRSAQLVFNDELLVEQRFLGLGLQGVVAPHGRAVAAALHGVGARAQLDASGVQFGVAAPAVDQQLGLGRDVDGLSRLRELHLGEQLDVAGPRLDLDVVGRCHLTQAQAADEQTHARPLGGPQALAAGHAQVLPGGHGQVLAAVQVGAAGRGGLYARRAGQGEVRFLKLGELACLGVGCSAALDGVVLRLQRLGHLVLLPGLLRLVLLGEFGLHLVLAARLCQTSRGLAHAGDVAAGACAAFGGDEQAVLGADGAVLVGAQLKALAALVLAALVALDAGDVAQAQLAFAVVAHQLGLHLAWGVVERQVVVLAAFDLFAAVAGQGLVVGQGPGRHVEVVDHAAGDQRAVDVAALEADDDFLADARDVDAAVLAAGPGADHAQPAAAGLIGLGVDFGRVLGLACVALVAGLAGGAVPGKVHLDAAVGVGPE